MFATLIQSKLLAAADGNTDPADLNEDLADDIPFEYIDHLGRTGDAAGGATNNSTDTRDNPGDPVSDGVIPGPATDPDVGYYECEETVRYPLTTPLPPTEALLQTN